jgi:hypothetical protein
VGELDHLLDLVTMRRHSRTRVLLILVGLACSLTTIDARPGPQIAGPAAIQDLRGLDELKTMFNRDAGKVRLVLLLSPT